MKTLRNVLLAAIFLCLMVLHVSCKQDHTYYIDYNDNWYGFVEITVVDELGESIAVIDYLDKCDTAFKYQDKLETQPGWETSVDASSAYWYLKGL